MSEFLVDSAAENHHNSNKKTNYEQTKRGFSTIHTDTINNESHSAFNKIQINIYRYPNRY